ncbi:MAG: zinc ribbon domain-containing protein [Pirellula sp.]
MPLYEYECKECSKQVEILVPNATTKPTCPECGSKKLNKLLSVVASPVSRGANSSSNRESAAEMCGRPQCASGGCMFGN